ncbi:MAG: hypothetical protein A2X81_10760 [Desulfobacterales bacterium GWB2_56_26]|nr:MAG: hypothetical protein A2X81_10760 [Desulfobacterales bacterium GWB2_56_26]HBG20882.1 hypothetical protein [Desulfobulbaceae bacterium]
MGLMVAYLLLAVFFLALAVGLYTPKKWRELPEKHVKLLKFGCLFGSLLIFFSIVKNFVGKS